jgi:hypothetical protein
MTTRNIPGGKERPARKADKLTAICEPIFWKMWEPVRLTTLWASTDCYRDSFTVPYLNILININIIFSFQSLPLSKRFFQKKIMYSFFVSILEA